MQQNIKENIIYNISLNVIYSCVLYFCLAEKSCNDQSLQV